MDRLLPDYIAALEREQHSFEHLETVYLGGGTPSLLPAELTARLLRFIRATFDVAPDAEVTLEANPASTDESRLAAWVEGGGNPVSPGGPGFAARARAGGARD